MKMFACNVVQKHFYDRNAPHLCYQYGIHYHVHT